MLKPRTDEDILAHRIKLQFGQKTYEIKVLTILKAETWKEKYITSLHEVAKAMDVRVPSDAIGTEIISKAISTSLNATMLSSPKRLRELVFAYAPELPQDEILETATEEEMARAFSQIMQAALPFLAELGATYKLANTTLSLLQ